MKKLLAVTAIHDLQRQPPTDRHDPRGLQKNRFVFFFRVEESERINDDGSAGASGSKWQSTHITTNPADPSRTFRRELSRPVQECDREVEADDRSSSLRKGERMPPMATADIEDAARL